MIWSGASSNFPALVPSASPVHQRTRLRLRLFHRCLPLQRPALFLRLSLRFNLWLCHRSDLWLRLRKHPAMRA